MTAGVAVSGSMSSVRGNINLVSNIDLKNLGLMLIALPTSDRMLNMNYTGSHAV